MGLDNHLSSGGLVDCGRGFEYGRVGWGPEWRQRFSDPWFGKAGLVPVQGSFAYF